MNFNSGLVHFFLGPPWNPFPIADKVRDSSNFPRKDTSGDNERPSLNKISGHD